MKAGPRELRRLAFQALFQLDARPGMTPEEVADTVRASADESNIDLTEGALAKVIETARGAYDERREADRVVRELAPTWPAPRQPAVDRALLRLAHYEMTVRGVSPKVVVNEAVELAKRYSTERSPAFVNGVLDKILKRVLADRAAAPEGEGAAP